MADLVESVLSKAAEKEAKYKSIEVQKAIEVEIDEGNLLAVDQNPFETRDLKANKEEFLKSLSRDNTQLLINKLWELPIERVEDVITAKLPPPKTILPREKPIPKPKAQTKWQQYAVMKGIQNRKKSRMVWDEEMKEWRPRWGYKRANDEMREWAIEVPQNADPMEDQFEKRMKAKKERVAKNELQRLRNIARAQKKKVPGIGLTPTDNPSKDHVTKALSLAKSSTASLGKFTEKLPKEKRAKNMGKKRKFEPNMSNFSQEKTKQLDIFNRLMNKTPTVNITKAVNQHLHEEDQERQTKKQRSGGKGKGGKRGGKQAGGRKSGGGKFKGGRVSKQSRGKKRGGKR